MRAQERYSVSPLHSFCTVSTQPVPRTVTIVEALRQIVAWWRGKKPSYRQQVLEARIVERLAEEIAEQERANGRHLSG
jgi:hypothetical protein